MTATMTGTGGNGGNGGDGTAGGDGGDGGFGILRGRLDGINLAGAQMVGLTNTTVTAAVTGDGGNGGNGGTGTTGGDGGDGGRGIQAGTLYGINLTGASDIVFSTTMVTATMTGTGGNGGDGGPTGGTGANGGIGILDCTFFGIELTGATTTTLEDTTVTASKIGNGGNGGPPGGSGAAGISGGAFSWINPFPPPGVTLIAPTTLLGSGEMDNPGTPP